MSDDVVRALYREGQRRRMPMTRLADELLRQAISSTGDNAPVLRVCEDAPQPIPVRETDAA